MPTDYVAFANWLRAELIERGMRQSELARKAGIDSGYLSKVLSLERPASAQFCQGIARAFGVPVGEVYARVGLMPPQPKRTERIARMLALFEELTEDDKEWIEQFTRLRVEYQRRKGGGRGARPKPKTTSKHTDDSDVAGIGRNQPVRDREQDAGAIVSEESPTDSGEDATPSHDISTTDNWR